MMQRWQNMIVGWFEGSIESDPFGLFWFGLLNLYHLVRYNMKQIMNIPEDELFKAIVIEDTYEVKLGTSLIKSVSCLVLWFKAQ